MKYNRTFWIQAAHFNRGSVYQEYQKAQQEAQEGDYHSAYIRMVGVVREIHGHNFRVQVEIGGSNLTGVCSSAWGKPSFLVDDVAIEQIISKYDNTNWSVLPEFIGCGFRATTELAARDIAKAIKAIASNCRVTCTVHETEYISASYTEE